MRLEPVSTVRGLLLNIHRQVRELVLAFNSVLEPRYIAR